VYDITKQPDKHLAFGIGPHFCLGAPLARQEAQIALQTLFTRMPNLKLDERRPPQWQRIANLRGPRSLPVVF
jgi:cytochrome P450